MAKANWKTEVVDPSLYEQSSTYYDLGLFPYKATNSAVHTRVNFTDEVWFYTTLWNPPAQSPKARLLFVHGLYEHSILYTEIMDQLSSNGYQCLFYDQRGCGFTSLAEEKGNTNEALAAADLDNFIQYFNSVSDDKLNLYLIGHSAGGGTILDYLANGKYRSSIKGGIVTAPLIKLHPSTKPPLMDHAFNLINRVKFLSNYKFISKITKEYLTTNNRYLDFLVSDKLAIPLVSISQLSAMFTKGADLIDKDYHIAADASVLILHSEDDKVNAFEGSKIFYDRLEKSDLAVRKLVKMAGQHSLFIESEDIRSQVLNHILDFLVQDLTLAVS